MTLEDAHEALKKLHPEATQIDIRLSEREVAATTFDAAFFQSDERRVAGYLIYLIDTDQWLFRPSTAIGEMPARHGGE